jgi:PBSX family phage terminase large subunit
MKLRPFGEKAYNFIMTPVADDPFFTLLEGSIRSSKTWAMMVKLLALSRYKVEGHKVITGRSKNAIRQNVLKDLFDLVGKGNYRYNNQTGLLYIFGTEWTVIGAKDEGSEALIRGMTIGVCYSDETVLMPKSFFLQLLGRMSPAGARFYGTTNPDTPFHYIQEEVIQNKDYAGLDENGKPKIQIIHFTLDDNPNLSRKARRRYETTYTGVFYQRFILGLWVVAEGAIYRDCLGPNCEVSDEEWPIGIKTAYAARYIPVDYGTGNPTVFLDVYDDGRTCWQDKEYYWDSRKQMRQKTDEEYADDFDEFVGPNKRGVVAVVDPSAASFKLVLVKRGYMVKDAVNDVMPGIRRTSSALKMGLYRIRKSADGQANRMTWLELSTYAWDDKKAKRGVEEPIKAHDHAADPVRYCVHTMIPTWRLP